MSWRDPKFKYHDAEETRKPGYLAKRFAQIRKEQAEKSKAEFERNFTTVVQIKKVVK